MKLTALTCLAVLTLTALAAEPALAGGVHTNTTYGRVEEMIVQLLTARDDDDREDAAEVLGRIASDPRALEALEYAAQRDRDGGVRKDARKAADRVRARILAANLTGGRIEREVVIVERPPRTVVVPAPSVVHSRVVYRCGSRRARGVAVVRPHVRFGKIHDTGRSHRFGRIHHTGRPHRFGRIHHTGRPHRFGRVQRRAHSRRGGGLSISLSLAF